MAATPCAASTFVADAGADARELHYDQNPGLYSAAIGHHFGRPGNRFWPALANAGFTPRLLSPFEDATLPEYALGITNLVSRATARAEELSEAELRRGAKRLAVKVAALQPRVVAVLGVTAYRLAFARPKAKLERQPEPLEGSTLWVLPNPSGLNAHHQLASLSELFSKLREFALQPPWPEPLADAHLRTDIVHD